MKPLPVACTSAVGLPSLAIVPSSGPVSGQQDLVFVTAKLGFLVANNGGVAAVERTTNSGQSWSVVWQHPDANLFWVGTAGAEVVASGVSGPRAATDAAQSMPLQLVTSNQGSTWSSLHPSVPESAIFSGTVTAGPVEFGSYWADLRLYFADASVGFALPDADLGEEADVSGILRTTDGGRQWRTVLLPGGRPSGGIAFVNALHGFATGYLVSEKRPSCTSELWSTSDGGASWRAIPGTCVGYPRRPVVP